MIVEKESSLATAMTVAKLIVMFLVACCVAAFVIRNSHNTADVDWIVLKPSKFSVSGLILVSMVVGAVGWALVWNLIKVYNRLRRRKRD